MGAEELAFDARRVKPMDFGALAKSGAGWK
jgi:hypothetical protein